MASTSFTLMSTAESSLLALPCAKVAFKSAPLAVALLLVMVTRNAKTWSLLGVFCHIFSAFLLGCCFFRAAEGQSGSRMNGLMGPMSNDKEMVFDSWDTSRVNNGHSF